MLNAYLEEMNARGVGARGVGISPRRLAELLEAVEAGRVSRQKSRDVFKAMLGNDADAVATIRSLGLEQISDDAFLRAAVLEAIAANPGASQDVKAGKKKSVNFLMGQAMRRTKGQGNPAVISRLIEEILGG
jgi:aspartyl-tRNA(Asn)/glutamyl-tRNA(Gln) amidotransferase subunit B